MTATEQRLRADARRNIDGIRAAAREVFRVHGLQASLDEVARSAGVSKGTIYHRFGGRQGLIDAVVEDLVAEHLEAAAADCEHTADPAARFEQFLRALWMLQFDEPAARDVLLNAIADSTPLHRLCEEARTRATDLLIQAQHTGSIRADVSADDVTAMIWERGIVARACDRVSRSDFLRMGEYLLAGLRAT